MRLANAIQKNNVTKKLAISFFVTLFFFLNTANPALADTTSYTTAGSTSFVVPYYTTLTAEVWGGGGGGGGSAGSIGCPDQSTSGGSGGQSSFNSQIYGNGGTGGRHSFGCNGTGAGGSGGSASGGDTNTSGTSGSAKNDSTPTGGAGGAGGNGGAGGATTSGVTPNGKNGNPGTAPGGGGSGAVHCYNDGYGNCSGGKAAGGGGGGGYSSKTYDVDDLTPGASVGVVVGVAGTAGTGISCCQNFVAGAGAVGRVTLTYTLDTTGPTPSTMIFEVAPDDTSTTSIDMLATTTVDIYAVSYNFTYTPCSQDAGTGGTTSGWQSSTSYIDTGLDVNQCYGYRVQSRDAASNTNATSSFSKAYTAANAPSAPTLSSPDASTLTLTHTENGNPATTTFAVQILNASPADATWDNMYVDATGNPSASEVWLTDTQLDSLVINDLNSSTYYEARSKARNGDGDETAFSSSGSNTTLEIDPPTPDPMTFATAPDDASTTSIDMTATTASDTSTPIEYNFTYTACASNPGTSGASSGWQVGTSYTNAGLDVNACYGYTVQARDTLLNANTTSASFEAYTAATTPGLPTLSAPGETTTLLTNDANGNPSYTEFAVQMINTSPADATWENMYVDASGNPSVSEAWLTDIELDDLVITGLSDGTYYEIQAKARNGDGDETVFSGTGNTTTEETRIKRINLIGNLRLSGVRLR